MKLWTGETISLFGTRIGSVAMRFAAVITLRATPFQMGLLSAQRDSGADHHASHDSRARERASGSLNHSSILIGLLIGGAAGQFVGLRPTTLVGAAGVWLAAALLAAFPVGSADSVGARIEIGKAAQR